MTSLHDNVMDGFLGKRIVAASLKNDHKKLQQLLSISTRLLHAAVSMRIGIEKGQVYQVRTQTLTSRTITESELEYNEHYEVISALKKASDEQFDKHQDPKRLSNNILGNFVQENTYIEGVYKGVAAITTTDYTLPHMCLKFSSQHGSGGPQQTEYFVPITCVESIYTDDAMQTGGRQLSTAS